MENADEVLSKKFFHSLEVAMRCMLDDDNTQFVVTICKEEELPEGINNPDLLEDNAIIGTTEEKGSSPAY